MNTSPEAKGNEKSERAVIFGAVYSHSTVRDEKCLDELQGLVEAAGGTVHGRLVQLVKTPSPATYFGSGKIEELKNLCREVEADVAVFNEELSPAQGRNIEKILSIRVIDRSELILDIFANRAKSHVAKLQVSLAQLRYKLPRLKRMWTHLDRIHSAIGARGPGETQIESDRRLIRDKIRDYNEKLKKMTKDQHRLIKSRKDFKVSLVGYTNAGKSSLLGAMTGSEVYIADQLFATLDTLSRKVKLPGLGACVLSDTVGFVGHLPHHLVDSFHATLSEAMEADLLLHVVDASDPLMMEQVDVVEKVLEHLGCSDMPTIVVANKTDRVDAIAGVIELKRKFSDVASLSALTGEGVEELKEAISRDISGDWRDLEILLPYQLAKLAVSVKQSTKIISEEARNEGVYFKLRAPENFIQRHDLLNYEL